MLPRGRAAIDVITDAEAIGRFESVNEAETFEVEYWSLEQAKLKKSVEKPFGRRVVVVTGGAGTIGRAVGQAFAEQGAEIIAPERETPFERFFFRDPNGYVFEIVEAEHASET